MREQHPDYLDFGHVARERCQQQCQYASRYINQDGRWLERGYPQLGQGLRFLNLDTGSYHDILIHRDDVETFVVRYNAYTNMVRNGVQASVAAPIAMNAQALDMSKSRQEMLDYLGLKLCEVCEELLPNVETREGVTACQDCYAAEDEHQAQHEPE